MSAPRAGQLAKACNQIVATLALEGVAGSVHLRPEKRAEFRSGCGSFLGGFAASTVLDAQGKRMLEQDFQPGFKARLHQEELRLVLETAHRVGFALPGSAWRPKYISASWGTVWGARFVGPRESDRTMNSRSQGRKGMTTNVGFDRLGGDGQTHCLNLIKGDSCPAGVLTAGRDHGPPS